MQKSKQGIIRGGVPIGKLVNFFTVRFSINKLVTILGIYLYS